AWDHARSMELANMIKAIPYVEDARIIPNPSRSVGFARESKMTATLGVRTRAGHELSTSEAQTLRQTVAGCFGMRPTDVTVVDLKTGIAPGLPGKDDEYNSGYVDAIRSYTTHYQTNIAKAL